MHFGPGAGGVELHEIFMLFSWCVCVQHVSCSTQFALFAFPIVFHCVIVEVTSRSRLVEATSRSELEEYSGTLLAVQIRLEDLIA